MNNRTRQWLGRGALVVLALLAAACEKERPAYALTSTGRLLTFDVSKPTKIDSEVRVTGLGSNESLVQIDYRPSSDTVYCITNQARLCTVDPASGAAAIINATAFSTETLVGPVIDFNPAVDRLRVIASEQNLRVNPNDGTLEATDTAVFFDGGDVNDGRPPLLAAIAYDRNRKDASEITLFGLDVTTQSLVRIGSRNGAPRSPNEGRLFTVAALSTPFTGSAGFDIEPEGDVAYAALAPSGGEVALYRIDLATGAASRVDLIDDGDLSVIALTLGLETRTGTN